MSSLDATQVNPERHCLVDVRTPKEFKAMNIEGSINMPMSAIDPEALREKCDLVLVCASGTRARTVQKILQDQGLEASVLEGGVRGWQASGRPLVLDQGGSSFGVERQVRVLAGTMVAATSLLAVFVNPYWALLTAGIGCGLVHAGVTDTCAMANVLARLPYNKK